MSGCSSKTRVRGTWRKFREKVKPVKVEKGKKVYSEEGRGSDDGGGSEECGDSEEGDDSE